MGGRQFPSHSTDRHAVAAGLSRLLLTVLVCTTGGCRAGAGTGISGPTQPASGPGGADYVHQSVLAQRFGAAENEYWLFTPDQPRPAQAPLVIFLHGWGGVDPRGYSAWIEHIVRKGHIVVYPRYQANLRTPPTEMTQNVVRAVRSAVARLEADGPVRPAEGRWSWVGHSMGGLLAANLAAISAAEGFPSPAVLMSIQPGAANAALLLPLDTVPADTLALVLVGDEDRVVDDGMARRIHDGLAHLGAEDLEFVTVRSAEHLGAALTANHFSPLAVDPTFPPSDAYGGTAAGAGGITGVLGPLGANWRDQRLQPDGLDYYGYWKLLDGLLDSALRGVNREFALGGTFQQRFMGRFSDGTTVTPLEVRD